MNSFSLTYRWLQIELFIHIYSLVRIFPWSFNWWHVQLSRRTQIIETNRKEIENMNSMISIREIETLIWKFHPYKTLVFMALLFLKVLHKRFHKIGGNTCLLILRNQLYTNTKARLNHYKEKKKNKREREKEREESERPVFFRNIDAKILLKILATWAKQYIKTTSKGVLLRNAR